MQPQNDKLTPKQLRAVLAAVLFIFLLFGGIVGGVIWKGEQARVAKQQALIAQIKRDEVERKKARIERRKQAKANAGKPAKKSNMANQRGTTSTVLFILSYTDGSGQILPDSGLTVAPVDPSYASTGPSSLSAQVTVPANATLGAHHVILEVVASNLSGSSYYYASDIEVVAATSPPPTPCPTLSVSPTSTPTFHPLVGTYDPRNPNVDSNGAWSYEWTYTLTGPNADRYNVSVDTNWPGLSGTSNAGAAGLSLPSGITATVTFSLAGRNPGDNCASSSSLTCTSPLSYTRARCEDGICVSFNTSDPNEGYVTANECEAAGCGEPPPVLVTRYRCNAQGTCESFQTNDSTEGFASCEAANCPAPSGTVYWCVAGVVQSGTTPPAGITTYPSAQACRNAGCTIEPPVYTRYRCDSNGHCQSFSTHNPNEGFRDCESAHCTGIIEPPRYTRFHCDEDGVCRDFLTFDPLEGFEDCAHANCADTTPPSPCTYLDNPIANITAAGEPQLKFSLSRQGNSGWQLVITHALDGVAQSNPLPQITDAAWNWSVPRTLGVHHFIAELSKPGCAELYTTELSVTVTGDGTSGGGTPFWCVNGSCVQAATAPSGTAVSGPYLTSGQCNSACGGSNNGDCPPCPPLPDNNYDCAPSLSIQSPTTGASVHNFALVRVQLSDPNEETDPCHLNYGRDCNHEANGPDLQLFLSEYLVPLAWKHVSGSPLNGIWQALVDTRDYSNGAHQLHVTGRGVGCCRVHNSVSVTLANTLQGNIFYRDTTSNGRDGFQIADALIGVETRALEENTSRRYWEQWGVRSGPLLDGPYQHADWDKHQMVLPVQGARWTPVGERFERHTYSAHVTFRLPLAREVRFRRKWTPQFALNAFDLHAQTVAKIRPVASGRHYAFTTNPAQVWVYDGDKVKILGNFGIEPTIDEGELGDNEDPDDFTASTLDRSGSNIYAPDAIDCAVYGGAATGDKVYVVTPPSDDFPRGEVFAFDPDENQVALEYGIRRENRVPRFIEAVGNRVICLYVHAPAISLPLASKRTRGYDLTFATPQLLWQLDETATLCSVDEGTLFIACGSKLYSTDGATAPTLVHNFDASITAASKTFVGLANGELWKQTTGGWLLVHTRPGAIGGVTNWSAGTTGEAQLEAPHGVVAGEGTWLVGERANGTWQDERELRIPLDLTAAGKSVARVSALDHFSVTIVAPPATDTGEAAPTPQKDERLLVGTANSGLLFVYQRSLLSEKDGAIPASHDTTPRLFPFPRRV